VQVAEGCHFLRVLSRSADASMPARCLMLPRGADDAPPADLLTGLRRILAVCSGGLQVLCSLVAMLTAGDV